MRFQNKSIIPSLMFALTALTCGTVYWLDISRSFSDLFLACSLFNCVVMGAWGFLQGKQLGADLGRCCQKGIGSSIIGLLGTGAAGYAMGCYLILVINILPRLCDEFLTT